MYRVRNKYILQHEQVSSIFFVIESCGIFIKLIMNYLEAKHV